MLVTACGDLTVVHGQIGVQARVEERPDDPRVLNLPGALAIALRAVLHVDLKRGERKADAVHTRAAGMAAKERILLRAVRSVPLCPLRGFEISDGSCQLESGEGDEFLVDYSCGHSEVTRRRNGKKSGRIHVLVLRLLG